MNADWVETLAATMIATLAPSVIAPDENVTYFVDTSRRQYSPALEVRLSFFRVMYNQWKRFQMTTHIKKDMVSFIFK